MKDTRIILLSVVIILLIVFLYYFLWYKKFSSSISPPEIYLEIPFEEIKQSVYVRGNHQWSLSGHNEILISTEPIDKHTVFDSTRHYQFKKESLYVEIKAPDSLIIYDGDDYWKGIEPELFSKDIKVVFSRKIITDDNLHDGIIELRTWK